MIWNKMSIFLIVILFTLLIGYTAFSWLLMRVSGLWLSSIWWALSASVLIVAWTMLQVAEQRMNKVVQVMIIVTVVSIAVILSIINFNIWFEYAIMSFAVYVTGLTINAFLFWNNKIKTIGLVTDGTLESRVEGRQLEAQEFATRQLKHKFGNLEPELEEQIQALPLESLRELGEDLLNFSQLSQLEAWLKQAQA